jgi:uncharacterized metal-binding protein YceD (DUF177 family)
MTGKPMIEKGVAGPSAEFSRLVSVARLPAQGARYDLSASREECAALARRFGICAIDRLSAEVALRKEGDGVRLRAQFEAEIVQECAVSLEPFPTRIADAFTLLYQKEEKVSELDLSFEDEVEPLSGDEIDIGEAVAQQLSLSLDPYPRGPQADSVALPDMAGLGVTCPGATGPGEAAQEFDRPAANPFAKLAPLRRKE